MYQSKIKNVKIDVFIHRINDFSIIVEDDKFKY